MEMSCLYDIVILMVYDTCMSTNAVRFSISPHLLHDPCINWTTVKLTFVP